MDIVHSPLMFTSTGGGNSDAKNLVRIIKDQTTRITHVLLHQKEPVEILQVINLIAALNKALQIVVTEIDAIKASAVGASDHSGGGQLKRDIKSEIKF